MRESIFKIIDNAPLTETVYKMKLKKFDAAEKYHLVNLLNEAVIIDNKKQTILNSIKVYTKSIFDALDQEDLSRVRFYRNEL